MKNRLLRSCAGLLVCGVGLAPLAQAQNATWNGTTGNFNAAGNWSPGIAVPTGTAFFGSSGVPGIGFTGSAGVGGITFNPGAQAFLFASSSEIAGLSFTGAGVVNNAATAPRFTVTNGGVVAAVPGLAFSGTASAGNSVIATTNGGVTGFLGSSTAGNAIVVNSGGSAFFSGTVFVGASTAGNAVITNNLGGITQFNPSASAGNATFVNIGGTLATFSIARFINALTNPAGTTPMPSEVGVTAFVGNSTAANASITNNGGGVTAFLGTSTAGAATIVTNAGGATFFTGSSSGGTASLIVNSGGTLDLSAHALGGMAAGALVLAPGSAYQIAVNAAGQGNALALSGAAAVQGGTVMLLPTAGNYWRSPTYTIVQAAGGVTGALAGTNAFAFLQPTFSSDANTVYLTLSQSFARGGQTANQRAVGAALDRAAPVASGDFNNLLGALAVLTPSQGPAALNALSGQSYADFGSVNVQAGYAFLNAVSAQMAAAREGMPAGRVALAEACGTACPSDNAGAWMSALGGAGGVTGNGNAGTLTYNLGGVALGADYRLDPRVLVGASVGYVTGSQWVDGFDGRGTTDAFNAGLYASFASAGYYLDAALSYANATNRLTRAIVIPGFTTRTASGTASANQFAGQIETGYRIDLAALTPALALTPFARLQGSTTNQAGFSETGAGSWSLLAASQITNSLRSTLGASLRSTIREVDVDLRVGWRHEYADIGRPLTASFAGVPGLSYTVLGATPRRDSAVLGLGATAALASATRVYLRYEGEVGGGTDNHAVTAGLRLSW